MRISIHKKTFSFIFLILALTLLLLPFVTSVSEFMTSVLDRLGWYKILTDYIVPFETRAIAGIIKLLGYQVQAAPKTVSIFRNGGWETVGISWNCIGWQSIILFGMTLVVGLQNSFTKISKVECIIIGFLGTVLVNILRITIITYLIFNFNAIPATVLHDYLSAFVLIIWLFFFWWFSYGYILEEKQSGQSAW